MFKKALAVILPPAEELTLGLALALLLTLTDRSSLHSLKIIAGVVVAGLKTV